MNDAVAEFWAEFCRQQNVGQDEPYQRFYFGNTQEMADELAQLVKKGKKIASASLVETNTRKPEEAPILGGYSVVTTFAGEPICVIRTVEISTMKFTDVDARFAADEGEGDLSLEWWRNAHRAYFEQESNELGFTFTDDSLVCCERFVRLYPK